jgi:hypothetical protein
MNVKIIFVCFEKKSILHFKLFVNIFILRTDKKVLFLHNFNAKIGLERDREGERGW